MSTDLMRMQMIFSKEDMSRIELSESGIVVDLHGKHKGEAKRLINNIINIVNHPFIMDIIHGYNNGLVLKKMIHEERINSRVKGKYSNSYNYGETFLVIA
ncbi:MAG: hypothetical protein J6N21_03410 [Butyrivibrio sp.]|nr:hypothetical protein [Butyrivibrio sp.]